MNMHGRRVVLSRVRRQGPRESNRKSHHDAFHQTFFFDLVISYGQLDNLRVDGFRLGLLLLGLLRGHEPAAADIGISGSDVADSLYTKHTGRQSNCPYVRLK